MLTVADVRTSRTLLIGPTALLHMLHAARYYVFRRDLELSVRECTYEAPCDEPVLEERGCEVYSIVLRPHTIASCSPPGEKNQKSCAKGKEEDSKGGSVPSSSVSSSASSSAPHFTVSLPSFQGSQPPGAGHTDEQKWVKWTVNRDPSDPHLSHIDMSFRSSPTQPSPAYDPDAEYPAPIRDADFAPVRSPSSDDAEDHHNDEENEEDEQDDAEHIPASASAEHFGSAALAAEHAPPLKRSRVTTPSSSSSSSDTTTTATATATTTAYDTTTKNKNKKQTEKKGAGRVPLAVPKHFRLGGFVRAFPPLSEAQRSEVVCYAIHGPDYAGKFDVKRAGELGVPRGPLYSALVRGESVTLADGRVIQPSDCIPPPTPGPIVLILDLPSREYVDALEQHPLYARYVKLSETREMCIVHLSPASVIVDDRFLQVMAAFHQRTTNLVVNGEHCPDQIMFRLVQRSQRLLHHIHPRVFPMQAHQNEPYLPSPKGLNKMVLGYPKLTVHFHPLRLRGLVDRSQCIEPISHHEVTKASMEHVEQLPEEFTHELDILRQIYEADLPLVTEHDQDFEVIHLGTGSAIPSPERNVSGSLVMMRRPNSTERISILLDCGEGTYGQLVRRFGSTEINKVILSIRHIFVSHLHADHHLGLHSILNQWRLLVNAYQLDLEPISIVGPSGFHMWLLEYSLIEPLHYLFVDFEDLLVENDPFTPQLCKALDLLEYTVLPVLHCANAFALIIKHCRDWKLVYSGDTRPYDKLAVAGKDATLVIHEATFVDETEDAMQKSHSTFDEAVGICHQMQAEHIVLFHFSQRYPRLPPEIGQSDSPWHNVALSFDLMSYTRGELRFLSSMLPAVRLVLDKQSLEVDDADEDTELEA